MRRSTQVLQTDPAVAVVAAMALMVACKTGPSEYMGTNPPCGVRELTLSPNAATIPVRGTQALTVTVANFDPNRTCPNNVSLLNHSPSVATLSGGVVTGVSAGTAQIEAVADGRTDLSVITVIDAPVASLTVIPAGPSLLVGGTLLLTAVTRDASGFATPGGTVTWTSRQPAIASVSTNGLVSGLAVGSTTIVATESSQGKTDSTTVTVSLVPLATITVSPATVSVPRGTTIALVAVARDASGNTLSRAFNWSTSNAAIATVDNAGVVTGVAIGGPVTITATSEGKSGSAAVTVDAPPLAAILVDPATSSVAVGGTVQLTATPKDAQGNTVPNVSVTWTTSNASVATVSNSGLVTGVAAGGPVSITATAPGGFAGVGSVTVTASPPRFAYAVADQPAAAGPYTADPARQFNGLGGPITVTRQATGQYTVTIPSFGGSPGESRLPFVGAINAGAVICSPVSWQMIGVTDATAQVSCSEAGTGTLVDSPFTIMAIGQGGLPGRLGFAYSGSVASLPPPLVTATANAASAWSSEGTTPTIQWAGVSAGRYYINPFLPLLPATLVPVSWPVGSAATRCTLGSWGTILDILCWQPGANTLLDSPFAGIMLEQGRPGLRFGAAWANNPTAASYPAPALLGRNSTGQGITISRSGTGTYRVSFAGLATSPGQRETVLITTQALDNSSCRAVSWGNGPALNLQVDVVCFNATGTAADVTFIVAVIE